MLTIRPIEQDGTWGAKQKKEYILDKDGNKIYDPKKRSYALKDEVKEVEQIRRNVYSILREENGRKQPTRKHEIER